MKAPELFALAVRLVALVFLYRAANDLVGFAGFLCDTALGLSPSRTAAGGLFRFFANLVAAIWFVFGADPFGRLAYPRSEGKVG